MRQYDPNQGTSMSGGTPWRRRIRIERAESEGPSAQTSGGAAAQGGLQARLFRRLARGLACAALSLFSAGAAWAFSSAPYFPLNEGSQWTYLRNGSQTIVETVQGAGSINGTLTTVVRDSSGAESHYTNDANGIFQYGDAMPEGSVTFTPPVRMAEADAALGVTLTSSGTATFAITGLGSFPLGYTASSTAETLETVTVPAGTFAALRFSSTLRISGTISGPEGSAALDMTQTSTAWLASGIGVVKLVTSTTTNGGPAEVETDELTTLNFHPVLSFSSTSANWGSQPANGQPGSVLMGPMVSNNSPSTIHLSSAVSGEFGLASGGDCTVLSPGQSCFISVDFRPASTGDKAGALTITSDAIGSPFIFPLHGTGAPVGIATLAPNSIEFGNQDRGITSAPRTVALTNAGSAPLAIAAIQTTGQYAQSNDCGASLAVGGSCQINVTFTPFGAEKVNGDLIIDTLSERLFVRLSGTGVGAAPPVSVSPASLDFGAQPIGTASSARTITLNNNGSANLNIFSVGPGPGMTLGDFSFTTSCPATLAGGANCAIAVTFAPSASGTRYGYLGIHTDGSPSGDFLLALTGTGTSGDTTSNSANLAAGWNLIGIGSSGTLDVATTFGDAAKVSTVWKWIASKSAWAFYTPGIADGGASYAAGKGYDFLASVNAGEGFWVNAKTAFTAQLPSGSALSSASFQSMASGWNLVAVGDSPTPSGFNKAIGMTPPAPGEVPVNLTTLWAWDSAQSNWYFYAPSLEKSGGLAGYIQSKNYLDFGAKVLGPTMGFWVNKP